MDLFPSSAVAECHRPGSAQPPLQQPRRGPADQTNPAEAERVADMRGGAQKGTSKGQDSVPSNAAVGAVTSEATTDKNGGAEKAEDEKGSDSARKVR